MPDIGKLLSSPPIVLALVVCVVLVLILAKREGLIGKKENSEPDIGPLKPNMNSGQVLKALLEQHQTSMPYHWEERVVHLGLEAAEEVVSHLEQRDAPLPGHWRKEVEMESRHQANNAVAPLLMRVANLEKVESETREARAAIQAVRDSQREIRQMLDVLIGRRL